MERVGYALLVLPAGDGPSDVRNMEGEKTTFVSRLSALVEKDEVGRWQEWLGTVEWKKLDDKNRMVIRRQRVSEDAPSVLGEADEVLRAKIATPWQALILCGIDPTTSGPSWILRGEATEARLVSVTSVGPLDAITIPFYATRSAFLGWCT